MNFLAVHRFRRLASLFLLGTMPWLAPPAWAEDPMWFKLNGLPEVSTGVEVDGSWENNRIGGANSTYDHLFITPLVGLRTSGSIYHPNLLTFDLDGDLGWGWDRSTSTSSGTSQTQKGSQFVNRYLTQVNLLETKPYNASFFAAGDHTHEDYGSFDSFTVDSSRYGGRVNWDNSTFSLNTDFGYRNESNSGFTGTSEISETYFNFVGIQKRPSGLTTLTYHINQFDNTLNSSNSPSSTTSTSLNQSVGLSDSESFGQRKQINATTGVSYSQAEFTGQRLEAVNANENISINHNPKLDSYLMMNFGTYQLDPATANNFQGSYTVRHQLFDSLVTSPDVHGSYQENSSTSSSSTTSRYGPGLAVNYTKRLQSWARLTVGSANVADHVDENSTGSTATVIAEPHVLSVSQTPVFLNQPNVIASSIQVITTGGILLTEGPDYQTIPSGNLTRIQLTVPVSALVAPLLVNGNLPVLVNYQSDSLNNASYEQFTSNNQIRLDMFGKYGVYGRWNWSGNNAPPGTVVESLTDLVGGADYYWNWFRAGAEYEDYNSNFSQYQAVRAYQNCNFHLDDRSTLSLNFSQSYYSYANDGTQTQFLFLSRYNVQLLASLALYVEGGASSLNVLGSETIQGAARTGLNWSRGKISVRTGYEYNNQYTSTGSWSQELVKNRFFLYLKRTF